MGKAHLLYSGLIISLTRQGGFLFVLFDDKTGLNGCRYITHLCHLASGVGVINNLVQSEICCACFFATLPVLCCVEIVVCKPQASQVVLCLYVFIF